MPTDSDRLAEKKSLAAALKEAVDSGLVTIVDGGDAVSQCECYLLPSGHYDKNPATDTEFSIKRSQYELFALLHIFQRHGVQNPIYVEGVPFGKPMPKILLTTIGPYRERNILDPDVQDYCFTHPDEFIHCLDGMSQNRLFYCVTSYDTIRGIHSPEVWAKADAISARSHIERDFPRKYMTEAGLAPRTEIHNNRIRFRIKGVLREPEELLHDCDSFIQYAQDLIAINDVREQELANRLELEHASSPMAWIGLSHEKSVQALCKQRGMRVISIIPSAAMEARRADVLRPLFEINLPSVQQLRQFILLRMRGG